jgi:hypothetical protein
LTSGIEAYREQPQRVGKLDPKKLKDAEDDWRSRASDKQLDAIDKFYTAVRRSLESNQEAKHTTRRATTGIQIMNTLRRAFVGTYQSRVAQGEVANEMIKKNRVDLGVTVHKYTRTFRDLVAERNSCGDQDIEEAMMVHHYIEGIRKSKGLGNQKGDLLIPLERSFNTVYCRQPI